MAGLFAKFMLFLPQIKSTLSYLFALLFLTMGAFLFGKMLNWGYLICDLFSGFLMCYAIKLAWDDSMKALKAVIDWGKVKWKLL